MKLTEDERHSIAHAEWAVSHATPEKSEVCFDYTLVQTLLGLIKSGRAAVGVVDTVCLNERCPLGGNAIAVAGAEAARTKADG